MLCGTSVDRVCMSTTACRNSEILLFAYVLVDGQQWRQECTRIPGRVNRPPILSSLVPALQKVLEIDSAEAKPDHGKTDGGKKVNPGPPSHALLEIGDEASVGNISEPMDEGQPQQSAGALIHS